jgi:hypothetical protein
VRLHKYWTFYAGKRSTLVHGEAGLDGLMTLEVGVAEGQSNITDGKKL